MWAVIPLWQLSSCLPCLQFVFAIFQCGPYIIHILKKLPSCCYSFWSFFLKTKHSLWVLDKEWSIWSRAFGGKWGIAWCRGRVLLNQCAQRAHTSERIFHNAEKKWKFSSEWERSGNEWGEITFSINYTSQKAKEPHWRRSGNVWNVSLRVLPFPLFRLWSYDFVGNRRWENFPTWGLCTHSWGFSF